VRRIERGGAQLTAGVPGAVLVHVAVAVLLVVVSQLEPRINAPVYAVDLVAAPIPRPDAAIDEAAPPVVPDEPAEAVPEKVVEPDAAPIATTQKPPKPVARPEAPKTPVDPKREPPPSTASQPTAPAAPVTAPGTGTDATTIKTPGLEFPYPEYLRNIMNQVYRRWGAPNTALRAEIGFVIGRDGSVRQIQVMKRSGNFAFDLDAQGAIEAAGNNRAFGPLPDGWTSEVLNVVFVFEPRR